MDLNTLGNSSLAKQVKIKACDLVLKQGVNFPLLILTDKAAFVAFAAAPRPETLFFAVFLFRFPISPDAMPIKKGNF
ncbi:putative outer membrane protein [Klebsiella pneumoniae]|uniref:Putative outer membrane protein n=1 Tax=Klebsiella pneumoniae TaxID=573 RepID=A0A2X3EWE1_KLEPN|nr:putative outer membrane protein [Klebsiella pneumoniae]